MAVLMILTAWFGGLTLCALGVAAFAREGRGRALPRVVERTIGAPAVRPETIATSASVTAAG